MIKTRKELSFYIAADRIMNGYPPQRNLICMLRETLAVGGAKTFVIKYLRHLRKYAYYYNTSDKSVIHRLMMVYEHYRMAKYAFRQGFLLARML